MFKYLTITGSVFLLSGTIFLMTLHKIDPFGPQKNIGILLFFFSFFLGIASFLTLALFFGKEIFVKRYMGMRSFQVSLRRSILLSLFCTVIVLFRYLQMLDIYAIILVGMFLSLIEYGIYTAKKKPIDTES